MMGARVSLPSGVEFETVSVHLSPPATRINIFSPTCWREHREDRQHRLRQIKGIKEHLDSIAKDTPLVVGGDFNANPWRRATQILSPRVYETFKRAGCGWPGTGPSNFPLWMVDQIWVSKHFTPIIVRSEQDKNSDHRMVICDLCKQ